VEQKSKVRSLLELFGLSCDLFDLAKAGFALMATGGLLYTLWTWFIDLPGLLQFIFGLGVFSCSLAFIGRSWQYFFEPEKPMGLNLSEPEIPKKADKTKTAVDINPTQAIQSVSSTPQPKTEAAYSGTVYVFANFDLQNMRSGKPGDFGFPVADNVERFFRIGFLVGTSKPAKMDFNRPGKKYTPPSLMPPLKPDENAPKIKVEKVWLIFNDLLLAKAIDWKARNVSDYEQLIATFAISKIPPGFIQDGDTTVGMKVAIQAGDGSEWRSISTAIGAGFLRF